MKLAEDSTHNVWEVSLFVSFSHRIPFILESIIEHLELFGEPVLTTIKAIEGL